MKLLNRLAIVAITITVAIPTVAHIEKTEPLQSLRQSYFALLGMTFGPMADMVKGKIEWNDETFQTWANDLAGVSGYQVERGFAPGSDT